ncbi:hypothetical protein [Aeromicrobium sp. UC242_57]|uniref:hypothetical protein n=1 Tax=Aeromicrobium sp. UC242_57 TaxID=3374624 RepID=UPI0037A6D17B
MAAELGPLVAAWCGDGDLADAVWQVASLYALDGRSLQSLLDDLDGASAALGLTGADRALERSLAVAWSEAALGRYSQLRCTDPMTGLATVQHLQTEVAGLCRRGTSRDWSLVVVEVGRRGQDDPNVPAGLLESFGLSEVARVVDRGCWTRRSWHD